MIHKRKIVVGLRSCAAVVPQRTTEKASGWRNWARHGAVFRAYANLRQATPDPLPPSLLQGQVAKASGGRHAMAGRDAVTGPPLGGCHAVVGKRRQAMARIDRHECQRLIGVNNTLLPNCHKPKIRPENKGLQTNYKPSQTKKHCPRTLTN
jgi:hypothetical protein